MTKFAEPLCVYYKGTAFNLYQIIMDQKLPFDYRAIEQDEFIHKYNQIVFTKLHEQRKMKIVWNKHKFEPYEFPRTAKVVELYSVNHERLLALLNAYPSAAKIMKDYCVKQTEFLRDTRVTAMHLFAHKR